MRRLLHALIVGPVAAATLFSGAHAETFDEHTVEAQPTALVATVVKGLGAAVRVAPSVDAAFLASAACGATLPVQSVNGGWVKVRTVSGAGWVSGGRVIVANVPARVDCPDARGIAVGAIAITSTSGGCMNLYGRPSDEAEMLACVAAGHTFTVVDGPFDSGEHEWFKVTSATTGTGWAPASSLT